MVTVAFRLPRNPELSAHEPVGRHAGHTLILYTGAHSRVGMAPRRAWWRSQPGVSTTTRTTGCAGVSSKQLCNSHADGPSPRSGAFSLPRAVQFSELCRACMPKGAP
jgi:hypothetical protein